MCAVLLGLHWPLWRLAWNIEKLLTKLSLLNCSCKLDHCDVIALQTLCDCSYLRWSDNAQQISSHKVAMTRCSLLAMWHEFWWKYREIVSLCYNGNNDQSAHLTLCNGCNYLSMPGLKLNHVSKRGPRSQARNETARLAGAGSGALWRCLHSHWRYFYWWNYLSMTETWSKTRHLKRFVWKHVNLW